VVERNALDSSATDAIYVRAVSRAIGGNKTFEDSVVNNPQVDAPRTQSELTQAK
jgi:hypothetical protein